MRHTTRVIAVAAAHLAAVAVLSPTTAHAAVDQLCTLNEVITYTPPLTDTPQTVTFSVNGQLFNCTSTSAATGSYAESGTVTGATCTGILSSGSGTRVFTWTNSAIAPSVFSYNRTATRVGGNIQVVAVGSIASGTFTPDAAKSVGVGAQPDPTACATTGVSRLTAAGSVTIGL